MKRGSYVAAIVLFVMGITLLIAGGLNGEFTAIYLNARILCLSCIGIQ